MTGPESCRYWEDFLPGQCVTSASRVVTPELVDGFAALTGDDNPLHRPTGTSTPCGAPAGRVLVHGLLGMALAVGLIEQTGLHRGSTIAMLDIHSWRFCRPVYVGDRVSARMTVAGTQPSRDRRRGVLVRHLSLLGDDGGIRQEGTMTLLVRRRT